MRHCDLFYDPERKPFAGGDVKSGHGLDKPNKIPQRGMHTHEQRKIA